MIKGTRTTVGDAVLTKEQRGRLFTDIYKILSVHKKGEYLSMINELHDYLADAIPHFKTRISWKTCEGGRPPKPENEVLMSDCAYALKKAGLEATDWNDRDGNESLLYKIYRVMAKQVGVMAPKDLSPLLKCKKRGRSYKVGDIKIKRNY